MNGWYVQQKWGNDATQTYQQAIYISILVAQKRKETFPDLLIQI